MKRHFRDRDEAGELLAQELSSFADRDDVIVLGLPRGGVPVAAQVAKRLHLPLDVFLVRKLGLPGYPELAMGAIASGGVRALNMDVLHSVHIPRAMFEEVIRREQEELERREKTYRDDLPPPHLKGKTVIVVDDGIATGSTMIAAIGALRKLHTGRIVVAAPVIAESTLRQIKRAADEVVVLYAPELFYSVAGFYEDFSQTTDTQVGELLAQARHEQAIAA